MSVAITHVAMYVRDLNQSREYYMTYFNGKSNELYRNAKGFTSYFITFESGIKLELMNHTEQIDRPLYDKTIGFSHIAFSVGSREAVDLLTKRITDDGYELYSPPRTTGDGYYESCVADADGNRVEITE